MKLYHAASSPHSRRVRIFIAEKSLEIDLVDLAAREQVSQAYRAINPRVVVPTLVLDDGTAIGEVSAIMRYLDEAYPEAPLLGRTPKEKAIVVMWERRVELEGFAPVMEGYTERGWGFEGPSHIRSSRVRADWCHRRTQRQRVANFHGDFEARLNEAEFVAGDQFSAADITMLVTVDFATRAFEMPIPEGSRALKRWHDVASARPSAGASHTIRESVSPSVKLHVDHQSEAPQSTWHKSRRGLARRREAKRSRMSAFGIAHSRRQRPRWVEYGHLPHNAKIR